MPIAPPAAEQRVVVSNVSWETFLEFVQNPGPLRGRLSYDQGVMEIMSPSGTHEKLKCLIARIVETYATTLNIDIASYGSTTFLREAEQRALEPDECYYVQSESLVRGTGDIDLAIHPPPDLVVEVDMSRSSLNKFAIYQSLGVPEIWRFDGTELVVHVRGAQGDYAVSEDSTVFPLLPMAGLREFLGRWNEISETGLVREFAEWVKGL